MKTLGEMINKYRRRASQERHSDNKKAYRHLIDEVRLGLKDGKTRFRIINTYLVFLPGHTIRCYHDPLKFEAATRLYCIRHQGAKYEQYSAEDRKIILVIDLTGCSNDIKPLEP